MLDPELGLRCVSVDCATIHAQMIVHQQHKQIDSRRKSNRILNRESNVVSFYAALPRHVHQLSIKHCRLHGKLVN